MDLGGLVEVLLRLRQYAILAAVIGDSRRIVQSDSLQSDSPVPGRSRGRVLIALDDAVDRLAVRPGDLDDQ
jgi:hypothetical protein